MAEICRTCGLPKEICACEALEKEEAQKIKVYSTKKRFGKLVTIIEGLESGVLEKTAKELKHRLACGGTAKDGVIILQGEQREKVKAALVAIGYPESSIVVR
ncbi:MAG: stress response translation initiation inhibitor YciH [Candidatus Micrarchaeia archaeon]